jgi:hypothetical protein
MGQLRCPRNPSSERGKNMFGNNSLKSEDYKPKIDALSNGFLAQNNRAMGILN